MEDISCFVSSECWSMEVFPVGVRLPKGDLHLGDGIRGVADYPTEIRVKALKLVNTLRGTFELPVSLGGDIDTITWWNK